MTEYSVTDQDGVVRLRGTIAPPTSAVLSTTATITNAQIKALAHPTPVEILAAPGSGKAIVPLHATARLTWFVDYSGIDPAAVIYFAFAGGATLGLGFLTEANFGVTSLLAGGEAASAWFPVRGIISGTDFGAASGMFDSDIENKAVNLAATNGALATDFTGGDAENVLTVTLLYYVVTF